MDPRMGPFDAVMFDVEDDPLLRSFIVVFVETEEPPDLERLVYRADRMSRIVPKLRQRVIGNPFSIVPPRWETDPNFDLDFHVRSVAMPGGTTEDVLTFLATWADQDFDRARPLWGLATFSGLRGDRGAVAVKIHHAITDGVGGMQLAAALLDLSADADDPADMPEEPEADPAGWRDRLDQATRFQAGSLAKDGLNAARTVFNAGRVTLSDPMGSVLATTQFLGSASRILAPASTPLSPIMTTRSLSSSFAELSLDLADLKAAAKNAGVSLNDVFVSAVIGALREYHERYGDVPDELRIHMPVNRRSGPADADGGNQWVPTRFTVPLNEGDAALRMRQLHPLLAQARLEPALGVSDQVYKVLMTLPRSLTTRIAGGLMKGTDFVATNVPGPPIPVYVGGARVTRLVPFAPRGGAAINVGLMSYNGRAEIGINMDREAVEYPEVFRECLERSFAAAIATVDE